jgi:hypothetical protein
MFDPSLKGTSQRRLRGSVQNGHGERMNCAAWFIKIRENFSLFYPTSNPVDSTDLKERQTNTRNKATLSLALRKKVDVSEKVSKPQAGSEEDDPKSQSPE